MAPEPVDLLITNGTVVTMDAQDRIFTDGSVAIKGDKIVSVGATDLPAEAKKTIDASGCIVLPGLINAHTHAAMTLFRGLADDLPLMQWLNHYIFPVEARMDVEFVATGTELACAEMILSGTTTFCDMYLFESQVAAISSKAGMRSLVGEVLYDFPSPNYGSIENGFAYTRSLIEQYRSDPLVSIAVQAHALYTCSPDLLVRADELARTHQVPLILHLAETRTETEQIESRYGCRPVAHMARLDLLGPHVIADHCVWLNAEEIEQLAAAGVRVVHCPESNMKLASGVAPVPQLISHGIAVGLGTDGCASNNNLDLFSEMDTTAKLHKVFLQDPTVMDARSVLRMATIEGARSLGLEDQTGSLVAGKQADVIVLDTRCPHMTPLFNPLSHLVYAARGADVRHSVINGRLVMENRQLKTISLDRVLTRAKKMGERVTQWVQESAQTDIAN